MATKVTLRQKPISRARKSLYLDYYPAIPNPETGKSTRREFLGLYMYDNPKTPIDKRQNKETLQLAEDIRAKRQLDIQRGQFGFLSDGKGNSNFVEYFKALADKRNRSNYENWRSVYNYLVDVTGGNLKFADLNEAFCNDFRQYPLTAKSKRSNKVTLSQNSANSYFIKFKVALKQAFKDGYLKTDLNRRIDAIKIEETERQYLSMEELNTLAKTDCSLTILKRAALFSALTGSRFSDIKKLVWSEVQYSGLQEHFIQFRQQKTRGIELQPVSEQAIELLGERGELKRVSFKILNILRIPISTWQIG